MEQVESFTLSKQDKKRFEQLAQRLSEEDVVAATSKLSQKIEEIEEKLKGYESIPDYVPEFFENLKILSEILTDTEFKIAKAPLCFLGFAVIYVVSPIDLIPDFIPVIGYLDDALILAWIIKEMCADEIHRYKQFCKARRAKEFGGHILPLVKRSSDEEVVIVTGFCSKPSCAKSFEKWVENVSVKMPTASISAFVWDTKDFTDFINALEKIRHIKNFKNPKEVFFKTGYSLSRAFSIWGDGKLNAEAYSHVLARDLDSLQTKATKKKDVTLVGHSLGARLIHNSFELVDKGLVSKVCTVGGAVGKKNNWTKCVRKVDGLYNFYSDKDWILKILYQFMELGEKPIGLNRIGKSDTFKRKEFDLTQHVSGHTKYANNFDVCMERIF